jgi:hypothetical protein
LSWMSLMVANHVSMVFNRWIVLKDLNRFHHLEDGSALVETTAHNCIQSGIVNLCMHSKSNIKLRIFLKYQYY